MAIYFNGVDVTTAASSGTKFAFTNFSKTMVVGGSTSTEFTLDYNITMPRGFSEPFVTFFLTVDLSELPEAYLQSVQVSSLDTQFGSSNSTSSNMYSIAGMLGKSNAGGFTVHIKLSKAYVINRANVLIKGYLVFGVNNV